MKNLISILTVIAIVLICTFSIKAQTRAGHYSKITADHWDKEGGKSTTVKYKTGLLVIDADKLTIDTTSYQIVNRGGIDAYDYGDYIQLANLLYKTKKGSLKAIEVVFYIAKDKKTITDVILKRNKHYDQTYTF